MRGTQIGEHLSHNCGTASDQSQELSTDGKTMPTFPAITRKRFARLFNGASQAEHQATGRRLRLVGWIVGLILACLILAPVNVDGAEGQTRSIARCRRLLETGEYETCIREAKAAVDAARYGEGWRIVKAEAEFTLGRFADADATIEAGLKRYPSSIDLRMLSHYVCLHTGRTELARERLVQIDQLATRSPWRYTDVEELVTLGDAALMLGAEPKDVLDGFYERAKRLDPDHRLPRLAIGRLALDKNDRELAADVFREAVKRIPEDADVQFGLAQALAGADPKLAEAALNKTLELNPNHIPALLFQVDRLIDSEEYDDARQKLARVLAVNPRQSEAYAYKAVVAHLENDHRGEVACRDAALAAWKTNPGVDHLIGRKLSQKYRFKEGAAYQRKALAADPACVPARIQLCQDLLRLGEEDEGWRLADEVHQQDGYDVATFNLLELRDRIAKFKTLKNDDFIVRMDAREADVYGDRVLSLLGRAKSTLCKKYGLELEHPIIVEIFPDENDFAVRTFGMPAASGYLGVCFGRVITANSPASQAEHPANWEAVLWHEFCHVVTLELTHNKMPRWLSEGISVYEELQENRAWGQKMNPRYREMILGGELTPVGKLSGAFLSPKTPLHLQFAYFESCLVVEYIVETYGIDALKAVLRDLGAGLPINTALERHTDYLEKLEEEFETFAKRRAEDLAPDADWSDPDLPALLADDGDVLGDWLKRNPCNVKALREQARQQIDNDDWQAAELTLMRLVQLDPVPVGPDNACEMLAHVYRNLNRPEREREMLAKSADLNSDALPIYLRLIDLYSQQSIHGVPDNSDLTMCADYAQRAIAVNPLIPGPHHALAEATEQLGRLDEAVKAYKTILALDAADPAETHYRLARILKQQHNPAEAKKHVIKALEEAPRFRAAHRLLLEVSRE